MIKIEYLINITQYYQIIPVTLVKVAESGKYLQASM